MDGNLYEEEELTDVEEPAFEPEPDEPSRGNSAPAPDPRFDLAVQLLKQVHDTLGHALELMKGNDSGEGARKMTDLLSTKRQMGRQLEELSGARILEGVFDGFSMVGSDGKQYAVPPNYASKSRLVEGDVLKLTIRPDGTFVYKQIGPIERKRMVGCLAFDTSSSSHVVLCGDLTFKLLPASVSYFRGELGDEVVCLVPKSGETVWAAVENIIKK